MEVNYPIKLPIFHHTDKTSNLSSLDLDWDFDDTDIRDVHFFKINAVSKYIDGDKEYTSIHANGAEYICALLISEVLEIINKTINERNNIQSAGTTPTRSQNIS